MNMPAGTDVGVVVVDLEPRVGVDVVDLEPRAGVEGWPRPMELNILPGMMMLNNDDDRYKRE